MSELLAVPVECSGHMYCSGHTTGSRVFDYWVRSTLLRLALIIPRDLWLLRQNAMEFRAADNDRDRKLDFKEFCHMVRQREQGAAERTYGFASMWCCQHVTVVSMWCCQHVALPALGFASMWFCQH